MFKRSFSSLLVAALLLSPLSFAQAAEGVAVISQVTRKSGGQVYRLTLQDPMSLNHISVNVLAAKVKLYHAHLITESNHRIPLMNLNNTAVVPAGTVLDSESINRNDYIQAIELRAESFGAYSDILVRASAPRGVPVLLAEDQISQPPSYPRPSPPPHRPPPPPPYYPPAPTPVPTPIPTPTPPEVIQLEYPFYSHPREYSKIECVATDKGWEEHGAHPTCEVCLKKHGKCVETCDLKYVRVYGVGVDRYGRIGKFEGRGADTWSARLDMQRVCDYYRLGSCDRDPERSDSNVRENVSRKRCG